MQTGRPELIALVCVLYWWLLPVGPGIAKEIDEDLPMGTAGGAVHVDPFTGTATTSIPINVLPGRNGVQPNLQLSYASGNGNGWVGMGWKLELGAIERNTRFGVIYSETPADNGKVYAVRMSGVSAELIKLLPNSPSDPEYRAKIESGFFRIRKLTTGGWEVTDRKGVKYSFGVNANARVEDTATGRIFRWNLERVEDRDGNYMVATYTKDQGQSYLDQITYTSTTKTAIPAPHVIKFYSHTPAGMTAPDTYNAHFKVVTAKRLRAIEVKTNNVTMRAYELIYTPSVTTGTQLLTQVQQFNRNASINLTTFDVMGPALPPIAMTYSTSASTFTPSTHPWLTNWCSGGSGVTPAEFNGDGQQDLWCTNTSNGFSTATASSGSLTAGTNVYSSCASRVTGDFDGDGKQDIGCITYLDDSIPTGVGVFLVKRYRVSVAYSTGSGIFSPPSQVWPICTVGVGGTATHALGASDLNGDGKTDVWCKGELFQGPFVTGIFSQGTSFTPESPDPPWLTGFCPTGGVGSGDFNGDGRADLVCHDNTPGTTTIRYSTSVGTTASFNTSSSLASWCGSGYLSFSAMVTTPPPSKFAISDFNGDGIQDLWCQTGTGTVLIGLSTGTSISSPLVWRTGFCTTGKTGTADFDGDGITDMWCHTTDGTTQVMLSTGSTFQTPTPWGPSFCATGTFGTADLNGDAKPDLWCVSSGNVSVAIAGSPGVKTDLLATLSNGFGVLTVLTYTPSTALGVSHTLLPYPVYVTTALAKTVSTSIAGAIGNQTTQTTYQYEKGYHSIPNRDFRGFQRSTVTACANCNTTEKTVTVTEVHQGSGTTATEDIGASLTHPDAPTKGLPYRILVQDSAGTPLLETRTTYATDANGLAPWFTPSSQVVTNTYANGVIAKTTQVNFTYDPTYGNVLREEHLGDAGVTGDEKTIDRAFANESTAWLIGFPTRETIYKGISTAAQDRIAETTFYYDGVTTCATASVLQVPTLGHLTRTVNWLNGGTNPETRMAYDQYGNKVCARDPKGNMTTLGYDPSQVFLMTSTNALGHVFTTSYYGVNLVLMDTGLYGQVKGVTDPNGRTTTSTYDAFGRRVTTTTPAPDSLVTTLAYNYGGTFVVGTQHVQSTISGGSLTTNLVSKIYFDGLGRTIKTESPGAADGGANLKVLITETQYDTRGLVKQTSLPYVQGIESATGRWTTMTYDALGRQVQRTNPDNTNSRTCYSGWMTTTVDPKLHKKVETHDAYGRLATVQEYTGQATAGTCAGGTLYTTTTYQYDRLGNLVKVLDTLGNRTTMRYDTLGRKIAMSDPDMSTNGTTTCGDLTALPPNTTYPWYAAPCWNYKYDQAGNLERQTDAKNQHLWFRYDGLNRRTQKDYTTQKAAGSGDVRYIYDDTVTTTNRKGRLKQVVDAATNVTFEYDVMGRVSKSTKILDGTTYVTTSAYDGLGRLTSVSYPTNPIKTVTYTYDGPQLKRVSEGATTYVTYANFNALGEPRTTTQGNGVVTTRTFDPLTFRLETVNTVNPNTPSPDIAAPTIPTKVTTTIINGTQIDLSWTPSLDNIGVTGYWIERCQGTGCTSFTQVGTSTGTTFSDMSVTTGTIYSYRVRATDAAGNVSLYSIPTPTTGYGAVPFGLSPYGS
ncbi:MAG: VCBS repeat-containing protein [Nitrospira sp.]